MPFDNVLTDEQEEKKRQETLASRLAQTDYSQMLKEQNIVRKDTVRGNMVATSGINPDQHARTLKVANEAGLEPSIVRKNPQKVELANRINSIDYDGIVNNAPALTSFLVDPKKAALIQDEVPFWQQIEEYWQDIEDAYGLGKQNLRTSEISFKRIESILIGGEGPTDEELKELDSMKYAGSPADDKNYLSGIPIVATENLPLFIERLKTGAEFGVKGGASGAVLGASAGAAAGSVVGGVGAIPGAAAGAAKGIRVGAVFGSKFGVAFEGFKQESGLALDEFLRFRDIDGNPIDKDVAATAALIVGIANASLEFVGDAAVLKQMPGLKKFIRFADKGEVKKLLVNQSFKDVLKSIGKRYAQVAATEGTTEALQEMITVAGGEISKALSDGEFDKVDSQEFFDRVAESFVKGTQGGIGLSTPGVGGQAIIDGRRISRAKKNAKNLSDRIDNILGSKLAGRSDIMLEELYQSVADSKGEGELHISAAPVLNQLQEAGQDPVQFFSDLGIDETQLFEAVSTGGDVVVKAGKVLSVAKDSDFKDLLLASVRKTPDAMTALEAEDYVGRVEKDAAAAVEKLNLEAEQVAQMESQANQVFDQVAEAIISGGAEAVPGQRFALAELYRANALRQMADWAAEGKEFDVVSFYEGLGLQFKREGFQQPESTKNIIDVKLSGLLNELRSAKKDTFKKQESLAFGRSISERAREIGVKDDRGDLKGQDIDRDKKPFVRNLLRDDGVSLDELGLRLFEEGYFSKRPLVSDLLDALVADAGAIDREGRIFSESAADPAAQERLTMLESLEEDLARSGLDIDELTNEQIIQALNAKEDVGEGGLSQKMVKQEIEKGSKSIIDAAQEVYKEQIGLNFDGEFVNMEEIKKAEEIANEENFPNGFPAELITEDQAKGRDSFTIEYSDLTEKQIDSLGLYLSEIQDDELHVLVDNYPTDEDVNTEDFQDALADANVFLEIKDEAATEKRLISSAVESADIATVKDALTHPNHHVRAAAFRAALDQMGIDYTKAGREGIASEYIYIEKGIDQDGEPIEIKVRFADHTRQSVSHENADYNIADGNEESTLQALSDISREVSGQSVDQKTLFQKQGKDKVRGGIRGTFGDFNSQFEIFVTPNMNLSTLLHESGHLFLEMLGREAALEDAPKRVKDNLRAALEWLEVDSFDQLESKHHEKWARSFEVYLREGKAPSARMQRAFDKFRAWLVDVYKRLTGMYDIEITPEIRGIFDILLASEQEVTQVEADNAFKVNQDISDLMVESEKEAYFEQARKSHDEAVSETLKRQMRIQAREVKKWWNVQKKKVQAEISDEVWNEPKYQAWHFITKGTFYNADTPKELAGLRLNRQKLIDTFQTKGVLQDMPRTVPPMWQKEGGLHPDELAEFVGYSSGQEMIQDIINAERPKSRIERLTQEKMERDNPMPDISEDAIEATFNDQRALFLASELKALRTRVSRDEQFGIDVLGKAASSPLGIMKEAVRRVIDQSKVSDITKPFIYLNNSQRAARAAQQAIVDEDYQTATSEKAKQLFNFLMFRAALDVKEKSAKIKKRLQDVSRKKINPSIISTEYIKAMKDITTAVLNSEDPDSEGSLEAAVEWAKGQENDPDNPANLVIPAMFMKDFTNIDVKNMTFAELQAIDSMIKSLREEGRRRGDEVTAEFRERDLDLAERVLKNVNKKPRNVINKGPLVENAGDYFDSYVNGHVTASSFFEEMDGFEDMGPVWTSFKGLAADMRANEIKMSEEKLADLRKIFNDHYSRVQLTKMAYQPVRLGDFGALSTITRQKLLALALNFGNEDNIQAVVNGYAVDRHALFRAIDEQLTKEDWQFVQKIWDHVDSYWPDVAALEKRFVGVVPEKVQAQAVETRHGTFKGGYYPLKYNSKLSIFANKKELDHRAALMGSGRTSRAMTEHGHTKERVGSGGMKVKLDLGVVFGHVNDVIHDLNFREGVWEMSKLLNGPSFSQAIEDTYGADVHANLSKWLKDIAGGPDEPLDAVGKALSWGKTGSTIVILGLSLATMAVQLLGVASTLTRLGTARTIKGLSKFYGNPRAGWKFVFENSPFMRNRFSNFDRDAQSFARSITNASISQEVALFAFKGIGFMDLMISMPTWLAAYQQGMDKFNNDAKKAAKHADNIVIGTQGSGEIQDLPAIMRGSIGTRLLTQFMSYFVAMGQLMRRNKIQLRKGDISPNTFALNMLYLVILPPIIDALMRGDEPDDDEGYAEWAAKKVGAYTVAPLVGVRSIASAVLDDYPFQLAPIQDQIKKGISGTSAVFNTGEDATDYQVKGAVTLFGVLTKTPTKKVYEQYDYWLKVLEGEEELTAQGLLFNKRKRQ